MSTSRPKPTAICLLALEILLCIAVYLLCVCIRRRRCNNRRWFRTRTTVVPYNPSHTAPRGLDPSLVASFPVFPYSSLSGAHPMTLDCAVCLSSFQEDDTLRFIPACQHVFHPECVDPWFALHATCPYCRAELNGSDQSSSGEVVAHVTVTNEVSGGCTEAARDRVEDNGRYTLKLSDEVLRNIVPANSDNRRSLAGESCPPMGRHGDGDGDGQDQK